MTEMYSFHPFHPDDEQLVVGTKVEPNRRISLAYKVRRRAAKRLATAVKEITVGSVLTGDGYHKVAEAQAETPWGKLMVEFHAGDFFSLRKYNFENSHAFVKWGIENPIKMWLDYGEEWEWSKMILSEIRRVNPELAKLLETHVDGFWLTDSRHGQVHADIHRMN